MMPAGTRCYKERRLREGGVGPEMRSPVGLRIQSKKENASTKEASGRRCDLRWGLRMALYTFFDTMCQETFESSNKSGDLA